MIRSRVLAGLATTLFAFLPLSACSSSNDAVNGPTSESSAVNSSGLSYIGQEVVAALGAHNAAKGRTWNVTKGNALDDGWLMPTPVTKYWGVRGADTPFVTPCRTRDSKCDPDFQLIRCTTTSDCATGTCEPVLSSVHNLGEVASKMCVGHSDSFYDDIYSMLTRAERFVDISVLRPPDGRFTAAIRNAITFLSNKANPPEVRVLSGHYPASNTDVPKLLAELTRDISPTSKIHVSVGAYRHGLTSWTHAKIIAVDGKEAMVGGHNLWTTQYLGKNPVHDLSMRARGPAAEDAHLFVNELWDYTCMRRSFLGKAEVRHFPSSYSGDAQGCPASFARSGSAPSANAGTTTIISTGRLGALGDNGSDDAILALINSAKSSIKLSTLDLGPVKKFGIRIAGWPEPLLNTLGAALARGVDVHIVLTNLNAVAGGMKPLKATYSTGWSAEETTWKIREYAEKHFPQGTDVAAALCKRLHVAPLRSSEDATWPDGNLLANHAKGIIVDNKAFYIGSQNLYLPNVLAEYGYIVDDETATRAFVQEYWSPAWKYSKVAATSGSDAPTCVFTNGSSPPSYGLSFSNFAGDDTTADDTPDSFPFE